MTRVRPASSRDTLASSGSGREAAGCSVFVATTASKRDSDELRAVLACFCQGMGRAGRDHLKATAASTHNSDAVETSAALILAFRGDGQ